jgi:hypothetical protein
MNKKRYYMIKKRFNGKRIFSLMENYANIAVVREIVSSMFSKHQTLNAKLKR